ncbi:hypothetical protein [Paenibacillus brasilensis]|uniref:Uncharacterized protein n=1 Tax=Paenibacillus brasilensis TaxID=128574 RepID=A0ABU0L5E9_9BACL|nr:hypothetical protein [Paenibacillus brasilensis]MDQ0496529.1 hypothetical protein [Paenibacillus brasilensis]
MGGGTGSLPKQTSGIQTTLISELDLPVTWEEDDAIVHNVIWGFAPDKLYHSYLISGCNRVTLSSLIKGQPIYVRVDAFNETGITEGEVLKVNEGDEILGQDKGHRIPNDA